MASYDNAAAKWKVEPIMGESSFIWEKRMKMGISNKEYWNIVSEIKNVERYASEEVKLAFLLKYHNSLASIVVIITDDCLGSAIDTDDLHIMSEDLKRNIILTQQGN